MSWILPEDLTVDEIGNSKIISRDTTVPEPILLLNRRLGPMNFGGHLSVTFNLATVS